MYPAIDCTNPYPVNDLKIIDGTIDNYALDMIEARCAWNITKGDPRIVIAIVDSDFEQTHEDLINQFTEIKGKVSGGYFHGTCVAGAASAETNNMLGISGVGYYSKMAGYRIIHYVTSSGVSASSLDIKNAIWEAYLDGQRIINVSWTGTGLNPSAAEEITESGTTLVLAAGNTPTVINHPNIANIPGVIVVSAVDKNNDYFDGFARNQYVDLCAPGVGVAIAAPSNSYLNSSGTSYASPLVAGSVALLLSVNPCLTPAEIETILKETTAPINNASLYPNLIGTGRLDTYEAVKRVLELGTIYVQNTFYSTNTDVVSATSIKAGYSVTDNQPNGNVVIENGSQVNFIATREIELFSGFEVENGASFSADIYESPCLTP